MSKFRTSILIIGMLVIVVAASLLTVLALYITGAVVTEKEELVYAVYDEEKVYDGTPLYASQYELVSGEMQSGHYAVVEFIGSQTDAGESKSSLSVKIRDEKGYDVSNSYKIAVNGGLLKVQPKEIAVTLNDSEVVYNGTKVNFEDYTLTDGELVAGHKIAGSQNAQLISVNDALPSDLKPVVFDSTGKDVTQNYNVHFTMGRIRVVPRTISVRPADIIKVYDGIEVNSVDLRIIAGSLAEGQYFKEIEINSGSVRYTDVCDVTTRITKLAVFQKTGSTETDVTENYDIDKSETGVLRIEKRKLTVTAKSGSWEYDGTDHDFLSNNLPLSCEGLAPGESLEKVEYSGTIKNVGSEKNVISSITLSNTLDNYDVTLVDGTLTIKAREATIITPTITKTYDGTPLYGETGSYKAKSINLAPGHKLVAESLPVVPKVGSEHNEYVCKIVDVSDTEATTDLSDNYNVTYYYGELTVKARDLTVITPTRSKVYDGTTLWGFDAAHPVVTENLAEGEIIDFPTGDEVPAITDVEKKENSFPVTVIGNVYSDDGKTCVVGDVTDNYNVSFHSGTLEITRLNITVKTDGDTKVYDGQPLKKETPVISDYPAGLKPELKEGEAYPEITDVDRVPNKVVYKLVTESGEAVDEKNYSFDYTYGYLEITPYKFNLKLKDYTDLVYNGEAFTTEGRTPLEENAFTDVLPEEAITLDVDTDIVDAGSYSYGAKLAAGYDEGNYDLKITGGKINIARCEATVTLNDYLDLVYTGEDQTPVVNDAVIDIKDNSDAVIEHLTANIAGTFKVVTGSAVKNAANYSYTVKFIDSNDDRNHILHVVGGDITISQCPIDISLPDGEEYIYNGLSRLPSVDVMTAELPNGLTNADFRIVSESGSIIDASETPYYYTVQMINSREAVNYDLNITGGNLTIRKCTFTLDLYSATDITYDGLSHLPTLEEAIVADDLPEHLTPNRFEIVCRDDMKSVGSHKYEVAFRNVSDYSNNDFRITTEGSISIVKCPVTVKLKDYTAQYTDEVQKPLLNTSILELTCASTSLITKEKAKDYFEIYTSEQIKDAKAYTYGVKFIYRDDAENFDLTVTDEGGGSNEGKYVVKKYKATFTSTVPQVVKTYDGKGYTLDCEVAKNNGQIKLTDAEPVDSPLTYTVSATCSTAIPYEGDQNIPFANVRAYNSYGEDITRNFEITNTATLSLKINPRSITFTLDNYICTSASRPSAGSTEFLKCIGVSATTPLISGYSINVDEVYVLYRTSDSTLTIYDFDSVIIYNEEGEDVTTNFTITNTEPLTSSVIVMS